MTGLGFWHDNNLQPTKRKGNPAYRNTSIKLDEIIREKWARKFKNNLAGTKPCQNTKSTCWLTLDGRKEKQS